MPMIGHDAVRKKCNVDALDGFLEQVFKCEVVLGVMEKKRAFGRSIENVKHHSGGAFPASSRHCAAYKAMGVPGLCLATVLKK